MKTKPSTIKNEIKIHGHELLISLVFMFSFFTNTGFSQVVSPVQGGHYSPWVKNVRDMATPPPGLFVLWYNVYATSDSYFDRAGNEFNSIRLDQIHPALPNISVDMNLNAFATIPTIFWASSFKILGGARYMAGISPGYTSADVSIVTERGGIILDTTYTRAIEGKVSGFTDLFVAPVGLSWELDKVDFTFLYGFYAPTGKYETGSTDNMGLGFWTHQFQGYTYFYPAAEKSTALMLGLTYELNATIKDADVAPGNRVSLEWGLSQYLSERFELGVMGGHNWQVSNDSGDDVYWDPGFHDRKSNLIFNAAYWVWKEHLLLSFKYGFDYGLRQRFKNNNMMLNLVFVPGIMNGSKKAD